MAMSDEYRRRLDQVVALYIQELTDGCVECSYDGVTCKKHTMSIHDVYISPRESLPQEYQDMLNRPLKEDEGDE